MERTSERIGFFVAIVMAAAIGGGNIGCGTTCEQIARQRQDFLDRTAEPTDRPHLIAALPLSMVNQMIEPRVGDLPPHPIEVPMSGLLTSVLGGFLDGLVLHTRQVRLVPAAHDQVGIEVLLDAVRQGETYFSLHVEGQIEPRLDAENHRVEVVLRADDFDRMEPVLSGGAAERLGRILHRQLPTMARMMISPGQLAAAASLITGHVLSVSYPALRSSLFAGVGPLAQFAIDLPELPLERVEFSTVEAGGGLLVLRAHTSFPVTSGLPPGTVLAPGGENVDMVLTGSVVAELANWAMARGRLPNRFDGRGEPTDQGQYEVALSWSDEPEERRPLRVHVWKLEPRCLMAVISANPELSLSEGRIVLDVEDRRVEQLEGPPLAEIARWFAPIWLRALSHTQSAAASFSLDAGGDNVTARVVGIERTGPTVRLSLQFANEPTRP